MTISIARKIRETHFRETSHPGGVDPTDSQECNQPHSAVGQPYRPLFLILGAALAYAAWEVFSHRVLMTLPMSLWHWLSGGAGALMALTITAIATRAILDQQHRLERLARQKESLAHQKDEMTRMLVHDLRDPLMALRVSVDIVRSELSGPIPTDAKETLGVALDSARNMTGMVEDLLDIARMEEGDPILFREEADPWSFLYGPVRAIRPYAEAQDVRISAEIDPELPELFLDPEKTRRVVTNLLTNAVKVTPPGGVVSLRAEWCALQRRLILSVSDEGPGLSAEEQATLFAWPRPIAPRRPRTAAALGLAFCRMIAEAHGGSIGVQSAPLSGATLTVEIPA